MRLTKLKLAGFKSFVDPTLISLPGQLVGVVGPNGCGKSNIIDAVRWVLGESKASELRGESMQDVIFNGTTERKPVSRAMVELVFDNSQGRALGQWTQYAELSVKRVLTRDGHSDYLINNIKVRRKDITDLFLGTGLGPRAYAIIGQGMIARIIEARPEELRVFLEEAAGVSKYKERRRETENRLADTRENLVRVDDIRDELNARIEHLDEQAEVARRYHALNDELTQKQHLLWFARRRDAETERRKVGVEVERTQNTLEARLADLRATEAKLEEARTAHFAAGDALHTAQADLYEANAEVARLETELRHQRQLRQSVINRVAVLETEAGKWAGQVEQSGRDEERWSELRTLAEQRVEQGVERLESRRDRLPQAEAAEAEARAEVGRLRAELARAEQALQVEQTHRTHAERALETLAARHKRLVADQQSLTPPDQAALVAAQAELEKLVEKLAQTEKDQLQAQENSDRLKVEREAAQNAFTQSERIRTELAARLAALKQVQNRAAGRGRLGDWLKKYGLENATPLWKRLDVEPGWENALESVLREKLNAVDTAGIALSGLLDEMLRNPPGGKQTLLVDGGAAQETTHVQPDTLLARLRASESGHQPLLAEWLAGIRVVASLDEGFARRDELARGEAFVCPAGHVIRRGELSFFAPDEVGHGLLEREREIETIQSELADAETALEETRRAGDEIRAASLAAEHVLGEQRQKAQSCGRERHDRQLAVLKLTQIAERFDEQSARITGQLADLEKEKNDESARLAAAEQAIDVARGKISGLQESLSKARGVSSEAERCLREEREAVAVLERELGEARFSQRECKTKLDDIQRNRQLAQEQSERVAHELDECRIRLQDMRAEVLEPQLEAALGVRVEREEALGAARRILEEATAQVVALDESRLKNERDIEPLREKIGELKLKQQAAELNVEQMTEQLLEAGADESVLENLSGRLTPSALNNEIGRLQKEIAALGAVNLAALEELETARERAVYLDEQAADLNLAMETLENAIRRIDKETRELLQNTFDAVNRHFDELFPTLFGGGRACLVMTGEEILDAGIQVTAQPPGKKNSTIHLLSGGEKALTAIALIFSIFQLNPAPFCLLDEVDAPLDDANTVRFSNMVKKMSVYTQFLFISHNKISMEMAEQLIGVTMREQGVSRIVEVDIEDAMEMREPAIA